MLFSMEVISYFFRHGKGLPYFCQSIRFVVSIFAFPYTAISLGNPTLVSPGINSAPGQTVSTLTPVFRWNSASGASYYGLYISKSPYGAGNIVFDSEIHYGATYGTLFTLPSGYLQNGVQYGDRYKPGACAFFVSDH